MEQYKVDFVKFLLETGALGVFEDKTHDRTLKSGRISPWFMNVGDFNRGDSTANLASFYADSIIKSGIRGDILYGIPEKGVGLAAPVAMQMAHKGNNIGWVFSRKEPKTH